MHVEAIIILRKNMSSSGDTKIAQGITDPKNRRIPADSNRERAMNCGRSSTGTQHRWSVCLKFGM